MQPTETMTITLRGAFAARLGDGRDVSPSGQKERGLLALLALSPDRRRSRLWLRDKLWSTRSTSQAATSLRRALANIRLVLGPARDLIGSDSGNLWLTERVAVDLRPKLAGRLELLEDLNIHDPEFDDWLRELRQSDTDPLPLVETIAVEPVSGGLQPAGLVIERPAAGATAEARYLADLLTDGLAQRFHALGDTGVRIIDAGDGAATADQARRIIRISVESVVSEGNWHFHLRGTLAQNRQFLWSRRLVKPANVSLMTESPCQTTSGTDPFAS